MLTGRFGDTSGRPYIEARLILPRLKIQGEISFLVDTGADSSVLMPADAIRLGVPFHELEGDSEMGGIGGTIHSFVERGILLFSEPGIGVYAYDLPAFDITPNDSSYMDLPSLLGRDVLDQWCLTYDPSETGLRAEVHTSSLFTAFKKK